MDTPLHNGYLRFKEITLMLIDCLQQDKFEIVNDLLDKRQVIIDSLKEEKLKDIYKIEEELQLLELESRLTNLLEAKRAHARQQLDYVQVNRNANRSYHYQSNKGRILFDREV